MEIVVESEGDSVRVLSTHNNNNNNNNMVDNNNIIQMNLSNIRAMVLIVHLVLDCLRMAI